MEDFIPMEVLQTCEDAGCEEPSLWFNKFMFFADMVA
jgi:hypothetical protein